MTNANPPPPGPVADPDTLYHVCFGAHPECSGCNSCPECQTILHQVATRQAIAAVFKGMGMPDHEIANAVEFAMPHYEAGYQAGMDRLHEGMRLDPYLRSQLHVSALRASPLPTHASASQGSAAAPTRPNAPQQSSQGQALGSIFQGGRPTEPVHQNGGKVADVPVAELPAQPARIEAPAGESAVESAAVPAPSPPVQVVASPPAKVRPMVREMTVDEIATAGHVLPDEQ
jgi:hypothetical protein